MTESTPYCSVRGKDVHPSLNTDVLISSNGTVIIFKPNVEQSEKDKFLELMYCGKFDVNPRDDHSYYVHPKEPKVVLGGDLFK